MECHIRKVGFDPGSVNMGVALVDFRGFRYSEDRSVEIPICRPLHMAVWNLKMSNSLSGHASDGDDDEQAAPIERTRRQLPRCQGNDLAAWMAALQLMVRDSEWLFEQYDLQADGVGRLPSTTLENQWDHIQTCGNKFDMFLMSKVCPATVEAVDAERRAASDKGVRHPVRRRQGSSRKYGIKSDGALDHADRKAEAIAVTRRLFEMLGLHEWIVFLDGVLRSGQKIDDMCDAFLLALQAAITEYEFSLKVQRRVTATPAVPQAPVFPDHHYDSSSEDDKRPSKKSKSKSKNRNGNGKTHGGKQQQRKRKRDDDTVEKAPKKKRKTKNKRIESDSTPSDDDGIRLLSDSSAVSPTAAQTRPKRVKQNKLPLLPPTAAKSYLIELLEETSNDIFDDNDL
jgi:hypothetical protein